MAKETERAAFGFRVKSGWATAIMLAGLPPAPRVVDRRVIDLCDPAVPASRQPYHAVMEASASHKAAVEQRLCQVVHTAAQRSVDELRQAACHAGYEVRDVGLVVGSSIDPNQIKNGHIRAHALEGQLFRTALEQAAQALGWYALVFVERSAYAQAARALGKSEDALKCATIALGRSMSGPWRAEEKMAVLAAWMALVRSCA